MTDYKAFSITLKAISRSVQNLPRESREIALRLSPVRPTLEDCLTDNFDVPLVYDDVSYSAELKTDGSFQNIESLRFFFGDFEPQWSSLPAKSSILHLFDSKNIFSGSVGLVYFTVHITNTSDEEEVYYSSYLSVCLRDGPQSENVKGMCAVIASQEDLLFDKNTSLLASGISDGKEKSYSTIFDHYLSVIDSAIKVYSYNASYFSSYSRSKLVLRRTVGNFEKLWNVREETLSYIAQHPEELVPTNEPSAISYGTSKFVPNKTLLFSHEFDKNLYENRVVLGFLDLAIKETQAGIKELDKKFLDLSSFSSGSKGYTNSSFLMLDQIRRILKKIQDNLLSRQEKLKRLRYQYAQFFPFAGEKLTNPPKPTAIFRLVPQYRQVYDVMARWFSERFVFPLPEFFTYELSKCSLIYEQYLLIHLVRSIAEAGWIMTDRKTIDWSGMYEDQLVPDHRNKIFNHFLFTRDYDFLELFYEPVISNTEIGNEELGLRRNSSMTVSEEFSVISRKHGTLIYTPDFVLKKTVDGRSSYLLLDAKFSRIEDVLEKKLLLMIVKYILGLSPVRESDRIEGLILPCGKISSQAKTPNSPFWNLCPGISPVFSQNRINAVQLHEFSDDAEFVRMLEAFL